MYVCLYLLYIYTHLHALFKQRHLKFYANPLLVFWGRIFHSFHDWQVFYPLEKYLKTYFPSFKKDFYFIFNSLVNKNLIWVCDLKCRCKLNVFFSLLIVNKFSQCHTRNNFSFPRWFISLSSWTCITLFVLFQLSNTFQMW